MVTSDKFIRQFDAGQSVFEEGDRGDTMFVVESGTVDVSRGDTVGSAALATLAEGEIFGEMALVDTGLRSATVRAGPGGARLVCIDQARFVYLVSQQPAFALCVMRIMAKRLADRTLPAH